MTWFWNWLIGNLVWTLLTSVVSLIFCRVTGRPTEISALACGSFIVGILIASGFMWGFSAQANKAGFLDGIIGATALMLAFGMAPAVWFGLVFKNAPDNHWSQQALMPIYVSTAIAVPIFFISLVVTVFNHAFISS